MEFPEGAGVRPVGICVCPWRLLHFNQKKRTKENEKDHFNFFSMGLTSYSAITDMRVFLSILQPPSQRFVMENHLKMIIPCS
jgi:hypothetical protein